MGFFSRSGGMVSVASSKLGSAIVFSAMAVSQVPGSDAGGARRSNIPPIPKSKKLTWSNRLLPYLSIFMPSYIVKKWISLDQIRVLPYLRVARVVGLYFVR